MSTIKTVLFVLAFFCVYGLVGRMDYDDAVMLENAQRQTAYTDARMDCRKTASVSWATQMQPFEEPEIGSPGPCDLLIY